MNPENIHHPKTASRARRGYLKAAVLLLLALCAGIVIGASGTFIYVKQTMRRSPPKAEQLGKSIMTRMSERVALSGDEKRQIESIIDSHMEIVEAIRQETIDQIRGEFDTMNDSIDTVLGAERSQQWEADKKHRYGNMYRHPEERHVRHSRRGSHR